MTAAGTAVYTRISQDQNGERLGVTRQLEDCLTLADKLGLEVTARYDDNDLSAFGARTRPGFEALLDAMKTGQIDALIVWHVDRLYRSMRDLERVIEIAEANRVQIRTVQSGELDLSTSAGRLTARILGSVARAEGEHKGERQRRANAQKAAAGRWQTANRPFGYSMTGEPLEPEATAFRTAVADVLTGKSIRAVAAEWNAQGLKTTLAGTTQTRHGKEYFVTGTWNSPRVRRLLVNPRYAGQTALGKRIYASLTEAREAGATIEIVDVFRRPQDLEPVLQEAIQIGARVLWLQLGICNDEIGRQAVAAGMEFVQDHCTKIEHARFADDSPKGITFHS